VPARCPHVEIQDFDNDGWPDIYISAGWLSDDGNVTLLIFRNEGMKDGLPRFVPPQPIKGPMIYYPAGPTGDYDNDGRIDIFTINWFQGNHCRLLHNESGNNHWLRVRVEGKKMNRMGIGAQVRVSKAGKLLGFQEVTTGYGYASGQPAECHFGLGNETSVDVEVKLPDGRMLGQRNVNADAILTVKE
jgi:hypothetical protein